jgi:hypothetical protein
MLVEIVCTCYCKVVHAGKQLKPVILLSHQGYGAVAPAQGLAAMQQLLSGQMTHCVTSAAAVIINPFDWRTFLTGLDNGSACRVDLTVFEGFEELDGSIDCSAIS